VFKDEQKQFEVTLPPEERVGWIWCLFFAYIIPEIMTFLRASRKCFFGYKTKPTTLQFFVVATAETLKTIGTGFLVFMILPNLDVLRGAMLTNCLCFVPGLIGKASFHF
jgi:chitin synthase